jgi:hypothetical protein
MASFEGLVVIVENREDIVRLALLKTFFFKGCCVIDK